MKRLCQIALAAALLAVPITAQAQCYNFAGMPAYALIERPHPQANLFPQGGWTLYPGEAGSGVPSHSHYSHVFGVVPPAVAANQVLHKLHLLHVPIKPPEPQFLGRNPAHAQGLAAQGRGEGQERQRRAAPAPERKGQEQRQG